MDEQGFWAVIEETLRIAPNDLEEQGDQLHELLSEVSTDDLLDFDTLLIKANHALYTSAHLAAGDLMIGAMSDDVFTDFRTWIVSRGHAVYSLVLADPDALADVPLADMEQIGAAETLSFVAAEVYADRTDGQVYDDYPDRDSIDTLPDELSGSGPLTPEERAASLPRLTARYGSAHY